MPDDPRTQEQVLDTPAGAPPLVVHAAHDTAPVPVEASASGVANTANPPTMPQPSKMPVSAPHPEGAAAAAADKETAPPPVEGVAVQQHAARQRAGTTTSTATTGTTASATSNASETSATSISTAPGNASSQAAALSGAIDLDQAYPGGPEHVQGHVEQQRAADEAAKQESMMEQLGGQVGGGVRAVGGAVGGGVRTIGGVVIGKKGGGSSPTAATTTTTTATTTSAHAPAAAAGPGGGAGFLPTDPGTTPAEQAAAIQHEDPHVVARESEKAAAEKREVHGERPLGTVVDGLEDDELWMLLRRFDVQINHVLTPARNLPPAEPDLRMTNLPDVPYRSDTLKSNFERVITAVGPQSVRGFRELSRLTDWENERMRTGAYCAAYFISWFFGVTVLGCTAFFVILVCFPYTRRYLFPQARPPPNTPPSATDPTNQAGDESLLGSVDGKVRHRSKAEQAEEQAFEARAVFEAYTQTVVLGGHRGKRGAHGGNARVGRKDWVAEEDKPEDPIIRDETGKEIGRRVPDSAAPQGVDGADAVVGGTKLEVHKPKNEKKAAEQEAKRKRDEMVAKMAKGTETGLGSVADMFEIIQNALSPPVPFPDNYARFKMAGAFFLAPGLAIHFVPARYWGRIATFAFGAALWGYPLAIRAAKMFVRLVPNYAELLDLRNSILSGTPTNAQLTLHLLRVAEDLGDPLPPPPPPPLEGSPKEALKDTAPALGPTDDDEKALHDASGAAEVAQKTKVKTKGHISKAFKKVTRKLAGFRGDVAVDGSAKNVGSKFDQMILDGKFGRDSPDAFACKLDGKAGHVIVDEHAGRVAWVSATSKSPDLVWFIDDIVELKKDSVSVPRIALGWMGGADIESLGLTIRFAPPARQVIEKLDVDVDPKEAKDDTCEFKTVERREQLFNRLIAMGPQRWEIL